MNGYRLVDREGNLILSLDDKDRLTRLLEALPNAYALQTLEGVTLRFKARCGALENLAEVGRDAGVPRHFDDAWAAVN
jgi:hypothetical protein